MLAAIPATEFEPARPKRSRPIVANKMEGQADQRANGQSFAGVRPTSPSKH